jgi:hypothetical protein
MNFKKFSLTLVSLLCASNFDMPAFSRTVCSKDVFGNTICDTDGGQYKVNKDVFGNTVIDGPNFQRTTCRKDVFGNTICE